MHNEIYRIAYQLNKEGKNPSVALIRSRLSNPTSLPVIVQALQQWKLTPELGKEAAKTATDNPQPMTTDPSVEQRLTMLENQVETLMQMLKDK